MAALETYGPEGHQGRQFHQVRGLGGPAAHGQEAPQRGLAVLTGAPGGDGWSVKRMRQWPAGAWRAIATLIDAVEHLGRWPEALRGGIICLTPKNGVQASAQNPLEARPIVLLAQLYRLWAAVRAADLVRWIEFHKLSPLEDAQGNQAAEELGLLAAGMLEEAEATNRDGAVLAVDQSKAYDRVPLDLLEELLRDSGVHPAIGGPMLCMARSRRRIKVLDAIGESRQPTSGLVPGCPMATFVEGLLMLRWRLYVSAPLPMATWARRQAAFRHQRRRKGSRAYCDAGSMTARRGTSAPRRALSLWCEA